MPKLKKAMDVCGSQMNDVVVPTKKYDVLKSFVAASEKENKDMGLTPFQELMCTKKYNDVKEIKAVEVEAGIESKSIDSAVSLVRLCNTINVHIRKLIKRYDDAHCELDDLEKGRLLQARESMILIDQRDLKNARAWDKIATNEALKANEAMLKEGEAILGQIKAIERIKTDKKMMGKSRKKDLRKLYELCGEAHKTQEDIKGYLLSWNDMKGYRKKSVKSYIEEKVLGEAPLPSSSKGRDLIGKLEEISTRIRSNLDICSDGDGFKYRRGNDGDGSEDRRGNDGDGSEDRRGNAGDSSEDRRGNDAKSEAKNDAKRKARIELYKLLKVYLEDVPAEVYYLQHAKAKHQKEQGTLDGYMPVREESLKLQEEWQEKNERYLKCEDDVNRVKGYAERVRHNYSIMREEALRENPQLSRLMLKEQLPVAIRFDYEKLEQKNLQDQRIGSSNPTDVARQFAEFLEGAAGKTSASGRVINVARQFAEFLKEVAQEIDSSELANMAAGLNLEDAAQETGSRKPTTSQETSKSNQRNGKGVAQENNSEIPTDIFRSQKRKKSDGVKIAG